ncbi:MAG: trypsin-like peptidase domain-containing protein [Oscillospiraceae bacterium]|nr:trypsin-like peptidase domain-containing protein [Oscillospiraceae bacterium]
MYENENRESEARSDGTYRYVRPETKDTLYRDAAVEPFMDAARMPRYYEPPTPAEPDVQAPSSTHPDDEVTPRVMRKFWAKVTAMCTVCALLGGLVGGGITALLIHNDHDSAANPLAVSPTPVSSQIGNNTAATPIPNAAMTPAQIYDNACREVVGITTEVTYHNMFGMTVSQPVSGTGFFISDKGYILTNYHVVEYAAMYNQPAKVITHDGNRYEGLIVGYDAENDIAVLQVNATGLDYASLGNSDSIHVGDAVYAVGNPLGELQFSMTTGSVSATDRLITTEEAAPAINMFQIDAAVNDGNSGGPVYDKSGQVVGVVTAKYSKAGIEGLGFAIPINDAMAIANDLITTGYVTGKAKLGVDAQTMSARAAMYYGSVEGAYIRFIAPGSCAETAGLKTGDVVYRFGALEVLSRDDLQAAVRSYHAGDTVEMTVFREGEHLTIMVTLDEDIPNHNPELLGYDGFVTSF